MTRTDWYGGLRWVSERNVGSDIPASVATRVVLEAGEASDRLREREALRSAAEIVDRQP